MGPGVFIGLEDEVLEVVPPDALFFFGQVAQRHQGQAQGAERRVDMVGGLAPPGIDQQVDRGQALDMVEPHAGDVDRIARRQLGRFARGQRVAEAREALEVRLVEVHQADRLAGGGRVQRAEVEVGQLLGREDGEAPPAGGDDGEVVRQVVVRGNAGAVAEPQADEGVARAEAQAVGIEEAGQHGLDRGGADVERRWLGRAGDAQQAGEHLVERGGVAVEVEAAEAVVGVEHPPARLGRKLEQADAHAVVEPHQVAGQGLVGLVRGLHHRPVCEAPAHDIGPLGRQQLGGKLVGVEGAGPVGDGAHGGSAAARTLEQHRQLGERRDLHVDRQQVAVAGQGLQRGAGQRGQALLVDGEQAGQALLFAVGRFDVDREGFEQLVAGEGLDEGRQLLGLGVQMLHQLHDMVEVLAEAAVRHEEGGADLALVRADDARAVEVDVQLQAVVGAAADQEGVALQGHGHDGRIPAGVGQEDVLALLQPEQRHGLEAGAAVHELEDDGEVGLQLPELRRQRQREVAGIAALGCALGVDAQVAVGDVVEQGGVHDAARWM
mmetsp:Transcript_10001/g.40585  ORF Transcript_10001/g.40585 Transcript_10001/m.40585 type:complete len:550 (-) Transcript_10001:734-2383(-)